MYEQTGRYYAFFGPSATVTPEEEAFFVHWTAGCSKALDIGAGLCVPASMLVAMGLEVMAFEPSPVIAALAMDRLNRGDDSARSVTLVEGDVETFNEPFKADFILMRSVLMLLNDTERHAALAAAVRHAQKGARLIMDVRTVALSWLGKGGGTEERALGATTFRRHTKYIRGEDGATVTQWSVDAERYGRTTRVAEERFTVRADTMESVQHLLGEYDFCIEKYYGGYDLDKPCADGDEVLIVVATL